MLNSLQFKHYLLSWSGMQGACQERLGYDYSFLYKTNGVPKTHANASNTIGVNHAALIATFSMSGGTNIKQMPRTLVIRPVPATIHRPALPPGIRNDRYVLGFVNRRTITETNISAYITK